MVTLFIGPLSVLQIDTQHLQGFNALHCPFWPRSAGVAVQPFANMGRNPKKANEIESGLKPTRKGADI